MLWNVLTRSLHCLPLMFLIRLVVTEHMNGTKSGSAFSANIVRELTNFSILGWPYYMLRILGAAAGKMAMKD